MQYVVLSSLSGGDSATLRRMDAGSQTFVCVVWAAAVVGIGGLHQRSIHRGLLCCRPRAARTGGKPAAGGADGATLPDETLTERLRLVGENWFATVASGTAFCTDCGDAMPSGDANPDVCMSQSKSQVLERRRQLAYRTYLSTTAFVDPKHAKDGGVRMMDSDRSIRWMDSGVQGPETQVSYMQTPADFSNVVHTPGWDSMYFCKDFRERCQTPYPIVRRCCA
ncbi:unnamed protein product [Hyaloperonospora brassicae]|uniref:RxLR effector candidate protein n=1 Tax=Hyaloperonospora brassicae TaxID=162125 RepID=A0AAV0TE11_HYABA|nr:unnamed protein product [Hyaloperonospora brassicae]